MPTVQDKVNITFRIPKKIKQEFDRIAEYSNRSLNNQIVLALSDWLKVKKELHPQFIADIKEAVQGVKKGKVEPVWKG